MKETLINKAYEYFKKYHADIHFYIHYENKYFTAEFFRDESTDIIFQLLKKKLIYLYNSNEFIVIVSYQMK